MLIQFSFFVYFNRLRYINFSLYHIFLHDQHFLEFIFIVYIVLLCIINDIKIYALIFLLLKSSMIPLNIINDA
jgi:hypothetical protein